MQGIYLTLERQADGRHKLLRIRFNRNVYSKKEAEVWWNKSKYGLAKAHNLAPGNFPFSTCGSNVSLSTHTYILYPITAERGF